MSIEPVSRFPVRVMAAVAALFTLASPAAAEHPLPSLIYRGCAETLPAGTFGCSNAENLRRQIAVPSDLMQGRAPTPTLGVLDADAMNRLRNGRTTPLIGSGASDAFEGNDGGTGGGNSGSTGTP